MGIGYKDREIKKEGITITLRDRNKQRQLWSDKEFVERLEKIKAKRLLSGLTPFNNLGQITKELVKCPSFNVIEKELLESREFINMKIKLDKKKLFK